jgi:hypothetical protein
MKNVIFTDATFDQMFFNTGIPMEEHVLGSGEFLIKEATEEAENVIEEYMAAGKALDVCIAEDSNWYSGDGTGINRCLLSDREWDVYYVIKEHEGRFWYVKLEMR